jgi:hypothetical protein
MFGSDPKESLTGAISAHPNDKIIFKMYAIFKLHAQGFLTTNRLAPCSW